MMLFHLKIFFQYIIIMKLYIDNREPRKLINYIANLCDEQFLIEVKQLDIGDYIIYDNKYRNVFIYI